PGRPLAEVRAVVDSRRERTAEPLDVSLPELLSVRVEPLRQPAIRFLAMRIVGRRPADVGVVERLGPWPRTELAPDRLKDERAPGIATRLEQGAADVEEGRTPRLTRVRPRACFASRSLRWCGGLPAGA